MSWCGIEKEKKTQALTMGRNIGMWKKREGENSRWKGGKEIWRTEKPKEEQDVIPICSKEEGVLRRQKKKEDDDDTFRKIFTPLCYFSVWNMNDADNEEGNKTEHGISESVSFAGKPFSIFSLFDSENGGMQAWFWRRRRAWWHWKQKI